jgi:hypothetical protein
MSWVGERMRQRERPWLALECRCVVEGRVGGCTVVVEEDDIEAFGIEEEVGMVVEEEVGMVVVEEEVGMVVVVEEVGMVVVEEAAGIVVEEADGMEVGRKVGKKVGGCVGKVYQGKAWAC